MKISLDETAISCDSNDLTMDCGETLVENGMSLVVNYRVGTSIMTYAIGLAPSSMGLSLAIGIGGTMLWGYYGSNISNFVGREVKYLMFDV